MAVTVDPTPNPNAMKFTVGQSVGGPITYKSADGIDSQAIRDIFQTGQVQQIFMTADFVSVTKTADAEWDDLVPLVQSALETEYL